LKRVLQEGKKALSQGNYSEAIASCQKAVQLNGRSAEAHTCLANALLWTSAGENSTYPFDDERLQRAMREDYRALELESHNAEAMAGLAKAAYSLAIQLQ
jgi:tetratricopeptide (TPR) repeat protein